MNKVFVFVVLLTSIALLIRCVAVTQIPPGLYIDEVSHGVNSYRILTNGTDEHGVSYPLWFKAFGEYKMPVMIYLIAASMALFGKSELAVRLPAILAGTFTVPVLFYFLWLLVHKTKQKSLYYLPYVSAVLLVITPWHVHFSRGGFEATIALFFTLVSLVFFVLYYQKKRPSWLLLSSVFLVLTMYTYNAYRIIAVLLFLFYSVYCYFYNKKAVKVLLLNGVLLLFLSIPVILFSFSPAGSERFSQTSIFSTYKAKATSEKVQLIPMDFFSNYLRYYSPEYLFAVGDQNGRHQVPGFGLLYRWESIFFVIGLYTFLRRKKDLLFKLTFFLLAIAPIPAALTIPSPHALRSLLLVIPLTIIVGIGITSFSEFLGKYKKRGLILGGIFLFVAISELLYFDHLYTAHYPKVNVLDWGASYKDMIRKAGSYEGYELVVIDNNLGVVKPYVQFYDDSLPFQIVSNNWEKPGNLKEKKVLLIRPDYKEPQKKNRVGVIYLPNTNRDIFAEFYSL